MNRRTFLKFLGITAAVASVPLPALSKVSKAQDKNILTTDNLNKVIAGIAVVDRHKSKTRYDNERDLLNREMETNITGVRRRQITALLNSFDKIEGSNVAELNASLFSAGGWKDYNEFAQFYSQMRLAEYKDMVTITFAGCSTCTEKKCVSFYKDNACYYVPTACVDDKIYMLLLRLGEKSSAGLEGNFSDKKICPDGSGYHWTRKRTPRFKLYGVV